MAGRRSTGEMQTVVDSLARISAVESPPDEKGERTIWHQTRAGADLVSTVNSEGRIIRQEFSLFEDHFVWSRGKPARTAEIVGFRGSQANKSADALHFDATPDAGRIYRCLDALSRYTGPDRYLSFAWQLLERAKAGEPLEESGPLTRTASAWGHDARGKTSREAGHAGPKGAPVALAPAAAPALAAQKSNRLPLILGAAGVVLLLAALALFLLR